MVTRLLKLNYCLVYVFTGVACLLVSGQAQAQTDASTTSIEEELVPLDERPNEENIAKDLGHEAKLQDLLRGLSSPDEKTRIESGMQLKETAQLSDTSLLGQTLKRGNNLDKQL